MIDAEVLCQISINLVESYIFNKLNGICKLIYILGVAYMKTHKTDDRLAVSHLFLISSVMHYFDL